MMISRSGEFTSFQDRWESLLARARKDYGPAPFEWLYRIEMDPSRSNWHVHAALRGTVPPLGWWETHTARRGLGVCDVSPIRSVAKFTTYILKEILDPALDQQGLAEIVAANGERLHHHSRGFFLDRNGEPTGGLRAALAGVAADRESDPWVLVYAPPGSPADRARRAWVEERRLSLEEQAVS